MTVDTIVNIRIRTQHPFKIHVFDNGSELDTRLKLFDLLNQDILQSLTIYQENTGCLFSKKVFHALTESRDPYYIVSDNDVLPPKVDPCWLTQMKNVMDQHPEIGLLALQLPPQEFQKPYEIKEDIVYCYYVGNTFKMVRTSAMSKIISKIPQSLNTYGDDSLVSKLMYEQGYKVAFMRHLYCLHIGQCEKWGYTEEQLNQDPRKSGYGNYFVYKYDPLTYLPEIKWRLPETNSYP